MHRKKHSKARKACIQKDADFFPNFLVKSEERRAAGNRKTQRAMELLGSDTQAAPGITQETGNRNKGTTGTRNNGTTGTRGELAY
eukprot:scaffold46189_cov43-Attheya_sp.AAC.2